MKKYLLIVLLVGVCFGQEKLSKNPKDSINKAIPFEPFVEFHANNKNIWILSFGDARILNRAWSLDKNSQLDSIKFLLGDVISRTPENYSTKYEKDGKQHIEFWDTEEYYSYIFYGGDSSIVPVQNAYTRARYYRAWLYVEEGNMIDAHNTLMEAITLEPDNPTLLAYFGNISFDGKINLEDTLAVQMKIASFNMALQMREYATNAQTAYALRGLGMINVELGDYESARYQLEHSLKYENHWIARSELAIIDSLEKDSTLMISKGGVKKISDLLKDEKMFLNSEGTTESNNPLWVFLLFAFTTFLIILFIILTKKSKRGK
jgi:tetratricopeptide (TPR) repeat protein